MSGYITTRALARQAIAELTAEADRDPRAARPACVGAGTAGPGGSNGRRRGCARRWGRGPTTRRKPTTAARSGTKDPMFADLNIKSYDSERAADFAAHVHERQRAERARHAGRQLAHDTAASARAAEKREECRLAIARRPRGQTQIVGHREDGSPVYRAIAAFRARPYTAPEHRKERPEPTIEQVNGWRYNVQPTADRIEAARKAEAPQVRGQRQLEGVCPGEPFCSCGASVITLPRDTKRAARKVRMAAKRRRGF